jgi:hypothetical protein
MITTPSVRACVFRRVPESAQIDMTSPSGEEVS